jgi:hypothetical protein
MRAPKLKALSIRSITIAALALLFATTALVVGPAPTASAAGCRDTAITHYDPSEFSPNPEPGGYYYYTKYLWTPYSSGCSDINIDKRYMFLPDYSINLPMFRVHYYPTWGQSYTNDWVVIDRYSNGPHDDPYNHNLVIIGDNVKNGTKYRVEVTQRASFHILD